MLDALLRPVKDRILQPAARLIGARISPNAVTGAAFVAGCSCAVALVAGMQWLALGLWAVNRILDGLDGLVARSSGRTTDQGAYLDIILDFVVYAAVPLAMAVRAPDLALACALLLGSAYVNGATWMYLSALLEKRGRGASSTGEKTSVSMPAGIIEGTETVVIYTLMIAVPSWRGALFLVAAGLIVVGAGLRFVHGLRVLRSNV